MKKIIFCAAFIQLCTSIAISGNEPNITNNKNGNTKLVWAEEKMGTYRGSWLGSLFLGRFKKSTDLCMIIFHEGDDPRNGGTARVFNPDGTIEEISFTSYTESYYFDDENGEEGTEFLFEVN